MKFFCLIRLCYIEIRNAKQIEDQTSFFEQKVVNVVEMDYLFVHALKILIGKKWLSDSLLPNCIFFMKVTQNMVQSHTKIIGYCHFL
mgnify:CR=1 FL=1